MQTMSFPSMYVERDLLIIQYNVREPDPVRGDSDNCDAQIVIWVPSEFHVNPLLHKHKHWKFSKNSSKNLHMGALKESTEAENGHACNFVFL